MSDYELNPAKLVARGTKAERRERTRLDRLDRKKRENKLRFVAVMRSPLALINGRTCPVCKFDFFGHEACDHDWNDVRKANEKFMLEMLEGLQ